MKIIRPFRSVSYRSIGSNVPQRLAYQPHEMWSMTQNGQAVVPSNLPDNNFFDGVENPSFDLPIEQQRGVDINDVWSAQMDSKKAFSKLRKGLKKQSNQQSNTD